MSRVIKFRGLNACGEFVYGLPSADAPNSTHYYSEYSYRICWIPEKGGHANQPIKNGTLGQFTGLADKNGVEIYEGDLVSIHDADDGQFLMSGFVKFGVRGYPAFDIYNKYDETYSDECNTFTNDGDLYFTVFGNIHQNPELLK